MAKERDDKPDTTTVVTHRDAASRLRTIADRRDITMAEALDRYAGPAILREYRKVLQELAEEVAPASVGGES